YSRDGIGRITSITYSTGGAGSSYTYDGQKMTAASLRTFTYDNFWNVATETQDGRFKITYDYDGYYPTLMTQYHLDPVPPQAGTSQRVGFGFDANKRINAIYWGESVLTFNISYNALGQYSQITYPSGQTRRFTYDDQGRLSSIANRTTGEDEIATFAYSYDHDWSANTDTMLGQRTSVMATGASVATTGTTKYIYDGNYQLTSVLFAGGGSDSFAYDAIGNRTIHGLGYTYYKNGTNTLNGNRLRSIGGTDYTYDANGNMTGHTGTTMYTWDAANRLVTDQDT